MYGLQKACPGKIVPHQSPCQTSSVPPLRPRLKGPNSCTLLSYYLGCRLSGMRHLLYGGSGCRPCGMRYLLYGGSGCQLCGMRHIILYMVGLGADSVVAWDIYYMVGMGAFELTRAARWEIR
jgi:hypothetical protein